MGTRINWYFCTWTVGFTIRAGKLDISLLVPWQVKLSTSHYIIQKKVLFCFLHIRFPTGNVCKHFLYVRKACTLRLTKLTKMCAKRYKIVYGHNFVNALPRDLALHLRSKVQHKFQSFVFRLNLLQSSHLNYDLASTICTHRRQRNREEVFPQPRG